MFCQSAVLAPTKEGEDVRYTMAVRNLCEDFVKTLLRHLMYILTINQNIKRKSITLSILREPIDARSCGVLLKIGL